MNCQAIATTQDTIQSFQINNLLNISSIPAHHGPIPALAWRIDFADCSITFSGDMNNDFHSLEKRAKDTDILVAHNARINKLELSHRMT